MNIYRHHEDGLIFNDFSKHDTENIIQVLHDIQTVTLAANTEYNRVCKAQHRALYYYDDEKITVSFEDLSKDDSTFIYEVKAGENQAFSCVSYCPPKQPMWFVVNENHHGGNWETYLHDIADNIEDYEDDFLDRFSPHDEELTIK